MKFLKSFYDISVRFSASLSITSNVYFHDLCAIQSKLTKWCEVNDVFYLLVWQLVWKLNLTNIEILLKESIKCCLFLSYLCKIQDAITDFLFSSYLQWECGWFNDKWSERCTAQNLWCLYWIVWHFKSYKED